MQKEYMTHYSVKDLAVTLVANAVVYGREKGFSCDGYQLPKHLLDSYSGCLAELEDSLRELGWTLSQMEDGTFAVESLRRLKGFVSLSTSRVDRLSIEQRRELVAEHIEREKVYDDFKQVLRKTNLERAMSFGAGGRKYKLLKSGVVIEEVSRVNSDYYVRLSKGKSTVNFQSDTEHVSDDLVKNVEKLRLGLTDGDDE